MLLIGSAHEKTQVTLLEIMVMYAESTVSMIQVGAGMIVGSLLGLVTIAIATVS